MTEPILRFMGVSAIKRGREDDFLRAFEDGREGLRSRLAAMGTVACSLYRQGRYLFLYAELPAAGDADVPRKGDANSLTSDLPAEGGASNRTGEAGVSGPLDDRTASAGAQAAPAVRETAVKADEPDFAARQAERLWSEELQALLEPWPSLETPEAQFVMRLNDIFHDDMPMDDVPWRRPEWKPTRRAGKLARLKPDMYASYIYYHYQMQEEQPRLFSKYYTIGVFGPYIFSYEELPGVVEPPRKGLLDSRQTPPDWGSVMLPHFEPWPSVPEGQRLWREMEALFHLGEQA